MSIRNRLKLTGLLCAAGLVFGLGLPAAQAAPARRFQVDQKGDFLMIGNTVGYECDNGVPAPLAGSTVGACGMNTGNTSPDVFWRSNDEAMPPTATASTAITNAMARSTAVLALPAGVEVTYARLYWAANKLTANALPDNSVTVDRVGAGAFNAVVNSDIPASQYTATTGNMESFYQSSSDITTLVRANGSGAYRVSGIETKEFANLADNRLFIAWTIVVFYRDPNGTTVRNLTLFDGLDGVLPNQAVNIALSGFLVPMAGFDAKLGVVGYEGDADLTGDSLRFNNVLLGANGMGAVNPTNNFFNSTRTNLGALVSNVGDLPRLTGGPRSMGGVDYDIVDVSGALSQGATSATIQASSTSEFFVTGLFVTSISTFKPDFSSTNKTFTNTSRNDGTIRPNDILEYTIVATNTGNDIATGTVLADTIPVGLTYVPGSIFIAAGANQGAKTDQAGDDQANFAGGVVTVRLGTGATAAVGGTLAIGASTTVRFRVQVEANAPNTINNTAIITASGMSGAAATPFPSDSDPAMPGAQPTPANVDKCLDNSTCANPTPFCRNGANQHPWICVECLTSTNCTVPTKPICNTTTGACGACTVDADCAGTPATPACNTNNGKCVQCTRNQQCSGANAICDVANGVCQGCSTDADCSGTTPICNQGSKTCVACASDGQCGTKNATLPACVPSGAMAGACVQCTMSQSSLCVAGSATPVCNVASFRCVQCNTNATCPTMMPNCNMTTNVCQGCQADADCSGATPFCATGTGTCVACKTSADCSGNTPICSAMGACVACTTHDQCNAKDAKLPACNMGGVLAGRCSECTSDRSMLCTGQKPQCLVNLGFCGCSSTDGDSECGGAMSGQICNAPVGICIPGCSTAAMRNGCPTGQSCSKMDGTIGTCGMGMMCTTDTDCASPRPKCDTQAAPRACVQCLANTDCGGNTPICDTTTKSCVECTQAMKAVCSINISGTVCLNNSTCGCTGDGDCGTAMSGRICDTGLSKCSPGCRGTGGNTCPVGFICTSMTSAIGACVPVGTPLDGGLPDSRPDMAADVAVDRPPVQIDGAAADLRPDAIATDLRVADGVVADMTMADATGMSDVRAEAGADRSAADLGAADALVADGGETEATPDGAAPKKGIDGYLAGGGCRCDLGSERTGSGTGLWLLGALGAIFLVGRRRRRG